MVNMNMTLLRYFFFKVQNIQKPLSMLDRISGVTKKKGCLNSQLGTLHRLVLLLLTILGKDEG